MQLMLICRRTPQMSTVAAMMFASSSLMMRPGMPRHMILFLVLASFEEPSGADGGLTERQAPVIRWNVGVRQHGESCHPQFSCYALEQNAVLETPARQSDRVELRPIGAAPRKPYRGFDQRLRQSFVEPQRHCGGGSTLRQIAQ